MLVPSSMKRVRGSKFGAGGGGKHCTFVVCISPPIALVFQLQRKVMLVWRRMFLVQTKGNNLVLLGDFNAGVGRSVCVDDIIVIFGEETCNASGNKLISFLNEVELIICNGRQLVLEPEWTRMRSSLGQKLVIDIILTDVHSKRGECRFHCVSDHFLVWLELGRAAKCCTKQKCS